MNNIGRKVVSTKYGKEGGMDSPNGIERTGGCVFVFKFRRKEHGYTRMIVKS